MRRVLSTETMPVLFIGHGSPMNAIYDNKFTRSLELLAESIPVPRAILVISAHWVRMGVRVTAQAEPRTIHDFVGFPQDLYDIDYPAPGDPLLATDIAAMTGAMLDDEWGFDHGAWAVIRHMYPEADVPMLQFALDVNASPVEHAAYARMLAPLRERGVLVVGSGNIVHNLQATQWSPDARPYEWAVEFDEWVRDRLIANDEAGLIAFEELGALARQAHPTREHYLPLLYAAALRRSGDELSFFHEGIEMGSMSMRGVRIG